MADETQGTQMAQPTQTQESVTNQTVTNDALSAAWDASNTGNQAITEPQTTGGEPPANQTQTDTEGHQEANQTLTDNQAEPPDDHQERSRLGRRLKTVEEKIDAFLSRIEQANPQTPPAQAHPVPDNVTFDDSFIQRELDAAVERGEIPATIITATDQWKVNRFVEGLNRYIGDQYAVKYLNTLKTPTLKGDTPDDVHAEVVEELQKVDSPFNLNRFNNPMVDARMNYLEAKSAILQKRLSKGQATPNVFKGKPVNSPPTGTSVSTKTDTAPVGDLPSLDEASLDFIKRTGMKPEAVNAALKSEMPYHLRGGYR